MRLNQKTKNSYIARLNTFYLKNYRKVGLYTLLSLPILLYLIPFIATGNKISPGDADFQFQLAEAFRRSVLEYGQFPWWNPWVAGGVPLYANAQFGVFSVQSPFILVFGSIVGLKIAISVLYLIGFYGLLRLFTKVFNTTLLRATLLAYIWTFGTFLAYRVAGGHFTFLMIQFFPWLLYFYLTRHQSRFRWVWFSLTASIALLSATHYMTIFTLLLVGVFILIDLLFLKINKQNYSIGINVSKRDLFFFIKSGLLIGVLSGYRVFHSLAFLKDYPRVQTDFREGYLGVFNGLRAIGYPFNQVDSAPITKWPWLEVSAYIGFATIVAFVLVIIGALLAKKYGEAKKFTQSFTLKIYLLLGLIVVFFALSMGEPFSYSPYYIFRRLPFFESFRVAPRFLALCALIILFVVASYKNRRFAKAINVLLAISVVELFFLTRPLMAQQFKHTPESVRPSSSEFAQQDSWYTSEKTANYDRNLYEATINNYGQIIADDPLINTTISDTLRCDVDDNCPFVLTNNAEATLWTPNKIILQRTGEGEIKLNMNPGAGWRVNGSYPFLGMRVVEPAQEFLIIDTSSEITVEYIPRFSIEWLWSRMF